MSTVVVGCDINQGNDQEVQDTICSALEKAGHEVEKLDIHPNAFASYDWGENGKNPKGKIGVYIIADGIYSISDRYANDNGFKYVYFVIRGDLGRPRMSSRSDFENNPIGADPDCSGVCEKLRGKTFPEMNEIVKDKCYIVFGTNAEEMAQELVKAMGGETTESSEGSSSSSTCKEALKDVLYNWDGEAECYIRGDTVYVRKIPSPTAGSTLTLAEGKNIDLGSVSITDYHPSHINYMNCSYEEYELTIQDETRVKRFGKIPENVTVDESVNSLEEAKEFLQREWNKRQRDNGHSIELKTFGHNQWRVGKWCRVYLPSFDVDEYMYITKSSHDDSGDPWTCNLTLADYAPGFGEPTSSNNEDDENKQQETAGAQTISSDTQTVSSESGAST